MCSESSINWTLNNQNERKSSECLPQRITNSHDVRTAYIVALICDYPDARLNTENVENSRAIRLPSGGCPKMQCISGDIHRNSTSSLEIKSPAYFILFETPYTCGSYWKNFQKFRVSFAFAIFCRERVSNFSDSPRHFRSPWSRRILILQFYRLIFLRNLAVI